MRILHEVTIDPDESMLTHVGKDGTRRQVSGRHAVWFGVEAPGAGFVETSVTVVLAQDAHEHRFVLEKCRIYTEYSCIFCVCF